MMFFVVLFLSAFTISSLAGKNQTKALHNKELKIVQTGSSYRNIKVSDIIIHVLQLSVQ